MKTLIKNGTVIHVFTGETEQTNVLLEQNRILGVGEYYTEEDADVCIDATGMFVAPGFMDGHIHIESTLLSPRELAKVCVLHGTTAVVADPHEIANVSGREGIRFMLSESRQNRMQVYITLPSCVPATGFDEAGAVLDAAALEPFYSEPQVLGLGEMMNYPGVLAGDDSVWKKIEDAKRRGLVINGHAPLLTGRELDSYIRAGIRDDHECSSAEEAKERIRKGQWVMIREGSFAKNLEDLTELFEEPYAGRCLLVTDDKHPADLLAHGHIDHMLRLAVQHGKSAIAAIRMATIQTATCLGIRNKGAVAPGYDADLVILEDLETFRVRDVFTNGIPVVRNGELTVDEDAERFLRPEKEYPALYHSVHCKELTAQDFFLSDGKRRCRIIETIPHQLITGERIEEIDFAVNGGIDIARDILKISVVERHGGSGAIGHGLISGIGIKRGAVAATVSHDSHNLVIVGADESDMAIAGNYLRDIGGGYVAVLDGEILSAVPLPIGGLMSCASATEVVEQQHRLTQAVRKLGVSEGHNPFTAMGFVCLPVIPNLKLTTKGLVNVNYQQIAPFFED